jgi:hypothetical protein
MNKTIAFLDSCVLYPFSLRDILIQFSVEGMYQAKWSSLVKEAAAIDGGCTHLVTSNLKHFDIAFASARGVSVLHPDEFLANLIVNNQSLAKAGFEAVIARCKNPPRSKENYYEAFRLNHLPKTAKVLALL